MELWWWVYIYVHFNILLLRSTFWFASPSIFRSLTACLGAGFSCFLPHLQLCGDFHLVLALGMNVGCLLCISCRVGSAWQLVRAQWSVYGLWQVIACVAGNRLCASLGWGGTVLSCVSLSPPLFRCSAHRGNFSASSLVCWNVHQRFHFVLVCVVAQTHNTALIAGCQGSVMLEIQCKIEGKRTGSGIRQPDSSTC